MANFLTKIQKRLKVSRHTKIIFQLSSKLLFQIKKSLNPEILEDLEKSGNQMKFLKRRLSYQIWEVKKYGQN